MTQENKTIAIDILRQITTDGKSDESTPTLRMAREMLEQLATGNSTFKPISDGVVAVLDENDNIIGSAFFAASRVLLTCAHIVEDANSKPDDNVTLRFHDGTVLSARVNSMGWRSVDAEDVALLELDVAPPINAIPLHLSEPSNHTGDFRSFGYPQQKAFSA